MSINTIATFKIKIGGLDFPIADDGFVSASLNIDNERNIFICIKSALRSTLKSQFNTLLLESDYAKFGSLIECKEGHCDVEDKEASIDFSRSRFITYGATNMAEHRFYIDKVAIKYSAGNEQNEASFHLNRAGFEIIKNYYGMSMGFEDEFHICTCKKDYRFHIGNSIFHPVFHFNSKDSVNNDEITIKKAPFIKADGFTDADNVLSHFDCLMQLMRIYYNVPVDYLSGEIKYQDKTIITYKIPDQSHNNKVEPLSLIFNGKNKDFECFISNVNNIDYLIENLDAIKTVVESKLTSKLLNGKTKFLVLWNAFENLEKIKYKQLGHPNKDEFANYKQINEKFKKLLPEILSLVDEGEKEDFKKKWSTVYFRYKPMNSGQNDVLSDTGMDTKRIDELVNNYSNGNYNHVRDLRHHITHGGMDFEGVNFVKINQLLSLITLLLLFSVIGLTDFTLANFSNSIIHRTQISK
jgi:hypothetical protein